MKLIHLNGDLLCAIDIETTGLDPDEHEIYSIAIVPLDGALNAHPKYRLQDMVLKPMKPENIDWEGMKKNNNHQDVRNAMLKGVDPFMAADNLVEWFDRLKLPEKKKIIPLAHNWAGIDKTFITKWLGPLTFESIFSHRYRDTMVSALYINDRADAHNEPIPFPVTTLQYIHTTLKLLASDGRAHTALEDCMRTAQIYKKLLTFSKNTVLEVS
jgi:DNA polymerase III epsilon subunit-like protein